MKFIFIIFLFINDYSFSHDYKIAVISDLNRSYGSTDYKNTYVNKVIKHLLTTKPHLVLITGDMIAGQIRSSKNASYKEMWENFYRSVLNPLLSKNIKVAITPGNHDASAHKFFKHERLIYRKTWKEYFLKHLAVELEKNSLHYSFFFDKDLQIISLDATQVQEIPLAQREWIQEELQKPSRFKIAFGHLPLFPFSEKKQSEIILDPKSKLKDIFKDNIDIYLSGHHHVYYPGIADGFLQISQGCIGGGPRTIFLKDKSQAVHSFTMLYLNKKTKEIKVKGFRARDFKEVKKSSLPSFIQRKGKRINLYSR